LHQMKRRNLLWYSLLFVAGCTGTTRSTPKSALPHQLKFAVTDVLDPEELQKDYDPFRIALEEVLETKIEFLTVESFTAAASALQLGQVDLVLAGPSEYVVIRAKTNASAIIAITRLNYRSVIAVPSNSSIKSLAQLQGKTIGMSDVGSTSGHLGPTKLLMEAGLNPKHDLKVMMLGDEGSWAALKKGSVDAWGGSAIEYEKFFRDDGFSETAFPLIAKGPPLPSDVFIGSSQLSSEAVAEMRSRMLSNQQKLIQALVVGEKTQKYKGSQLVRADDADYNMIREVYQAIGEGDLIVN